MKNGKVDKIKIKYEKKKKTKKIFVTQNPFTKKKINKIISKVDEHLNNHKQKLNKKIKVNKKHKFSILSSAIITNYLYIIYLNINL